MRVDRRALHTALRQLSHVASSRPALPVLSHVLLRAAGGMLTLTATDLTQRLTCGLPAEGDLSACLPAKLLTAVVKPEGKTGGDVVLDLSSENQVVVELPDGATRLTCTDPETFPADKTDHDLSLLGIWQAAALREALEFVLPAASTDPTRPHLRAVCLTEDKLVATDGHRMHVAPLPAHLPLPLLLPAATAATLLRLLPAAKHLALARADKHVRLGLGPWQLDTQLVDAVFPPYQQVLPTKDQPLQVMVESLALSKALTRLGRLTRGHQTTLRVNGVLTLTASDPDCGEAQVVVPTICNTHVGPDFVTGVDRLYLEQAIYSSGPTVELGLAGPLDPLRVDLEGERVAVIMPMRV